MKRLLSLLVCGCLIAGATGCDSGISVSTEEQLAQETPETKPEDNQTQNEDENKNNDTGITNTPVIPKVEPVKVEDAKIDFDLGDFKIEIPEIKPVKIGDARIDFSIDDFEMEIASNLDPADLGKLGELSDEEKQEIIDKKSDILTTMIEELEKYDLDVQIDAITGELMLDSSILFDNDDAEVSEEGKEILELFTMAYAMVMCDEEYSDFISKIIIEGHTDLNGDYDYNKQLSLKRAENVRNICLSEDVDISSDDRNILEGLIEAVGCSYDRPVKDENGEVDMDASRRVSFRFLLNIF